MKAALAKNSGNAFFTEGKYREASNAYLEGSGFAPKSASLHSNASAALFELGEIYSSKKNYERGFL